MTREERMRKIDSFGRAHAALVAALQEFPREMWQYRPGPDKWSIHEIIIHLADSTTNSYVRARTFVAEPGKRIMAYDQERWAREMNYHGQDTDVALELFRWLQESTYHLIKTLPDEVWGHVVDHPENGLMTFEQWLEIYERHPYQHIEQMRRNFEHWKAHQPQAVK